jgi:hypothetical protein
MGALYVTSVLYGVGSGIWIDSLAKITNPGPAIILPLTLGAAMPVGVYLWDSQGGPLHRGVPASIATGLTLGAVEGAAIAATQWQYQRGDDKDWTFKTQTTITWLMATAGGVGGWAFGEWFRPDPRSMGFIVSGAGWGAISGSFIGTAVSGKDWKDGASVGGLVGYNAAILGVGALSLVHTPSWASQKAMWGGYAGGAAIGCVVFGAYLFVDSDPKGGFFGPALGGLAGAAIAGALTWDWKDAGQAKWMPPFNVAILPPPRLNVSQVGTTGSGPIGDAPQGAVLTGFGTF